MISSEKSESEDALHAMLAEAGRVTAIGGPSNGGHQLLRQVHRVTPCPAFKRYLHDL